MAVMKRAYLVSIDVTGVCPPRGTPIVGLTFVVMAESEQIAIEGGLKKAEQQKCDHPRRFKNASFSVSEVKLWN